MNRLMEKMKKDKLKTGTVITAIIVFIVGIVVTAVNTGDTYASYETTYCSNGTTPQYSGGTGYCCPSGSTLTSTSAGLVCLSSYSFIDGGSTTPENKCSSYAGVVIYDGLYYCYYNKSSVSSYTSYEIQYHTTGGTYISSQWKKEGVTVTIKDVAPEQEGYTFLGWGTFNSSNVLYKVGASYSDDADIDLYAIYEVNEPTTYTITYFGNGTDVTGVPSPQSAKLTEDITITLDEPTRTGYDFLGWNDTASATTAYWKPGSRYTDRVSANLFAIWKLKTYDVKFYNGDTLLDTLTKTYGEDLVLSVDTPTASGYTFKGWKYFGSSGVDFKMGATYTLNSDANLYAVWEENSGGSSTPDDTTPDDTTPDDTTPDDTTPDDTAKNYNIKYETNGGIITGNPTTATYDSVVTINNPTKNVTIVGNVNKTGATVGENVTAEIVFEGWTSSDLDTSTAYYGNTKWSDGSTKVTATEFKNLAAVGNTVTLVANWQDKEVTLPIVTKKNYSCYWNTNADGNGTSYNSGSRYIINGNSDTIINMYAICDSSKSDEEITENEKTGDILIYTVWIIGIGALGYSVYYFMRKRNNM